MRTEVYKNLEDSFLKEWEFLWSHSENANYTNSPFWFLAVTETFSFKKFAIIAIYNNDTLVAVAPLVKTKRYGISLYTVAPADFICGTPFLLDVTNTHVLSLLSGALLSLGTISLSNISESATNALQQSTKSVTVSIQAINFFLPFVYENGTVTIRHKNKIMKAIRGFENSFTFRSFTGEDEEGLKTAFQIDNVSRKHNRGYNTFSGEEMKKFYQSLAKHFTKYLRVNILYFDKKPIAYEMGFLINTTYFGNQIAFIGDYSHYSPGKVLLMKLMEYLGSMQITTMDFGSGDSHVKRMFTDSYQQLHQVILSKNTPLRTYLKNIDEQRNRIYNNLHEKKRLYSFYRNIRKLI